MPPDDKEISRAELAAGNGAQGGPVYIAHQGRVIDVSDSPLWQGGLHMDLHRAGQDLTAEIQEAPHGLEVLELYPQVGVIAAPPVAKTLNPEMPRVLARLLGRWPILKRHPHPMVVHFPIVFMISATFFTWLYLITGNRSFEFTALNCLGGGVLFIPVAILTGLFTWWVNYQAEPLRPVIIKLCLSPLMLAVAVAAFIWRLRVPEILAPPGGPGLIYLFLVSLLTPLAMAIGWCGATLTFPLHGKEPEEKGTG